MTARRCALRTDHEGLCASGESPFASCERCFKSVNTYLKIGDVVCLKSGGPQMTIVSLDGDVATCARWVEHLSRFDRDVFHVHALIESVGN